MTYNPDIHHRRPIRLYQYDYSQEAYYFITVCTQARLCLFGNISEGQMQLNDAGLMVHNTWNRLPEKFTHMKLDELIVMPNHIHGTFKLNQIKKIAVAGSRTQAHGTLDHTVGRILQAFKSITTNAYIQGVKKFNWPEFPGKLWQRDYWDRVIVDDRELYGVREYIAHNPSTWESDYLFSGNPLQTTRRDEDKLRPSTK